MSDATEDLSAMKVTELKAELKKRGLKTAGNKAELIARLAEAMKNDSKDDEGEEEEEKAEEEKKEESAEGSEDKQEEAKEETHGEEKVDEEKEGTKRKREDEEKDQEGPNDKDTESEKKKARTEDAEPQEATKESVRSAALDSAVTSPSRKRKLEPEEKEAETKSEESKEAQQAEGQSQTKKPRVEDDKNSELTPIIPKDREVPPSAGDATKTLLVKNFVRPFTAKSAEQFLAQYGKLTHFWMNEIKTHCYISYESKEDAVAAREQIYGVIWPPHNTSKPLIAEFVADEVVAKLGPAPSLHDSSGSLKTSSDGTRREKEERSDTSRREETKGGQKKEALTLEDLFRKTKAKPSIYYLPLTDEEIVARKEAKEKEKEEKERSAKERDEQRRKEREDRMKERDSQREKEKQEREKRDKERDEKRKRSRSSSRSRSGSSSRSRSPSSSRSRSGSRSSRSRSRGRK